MTRDLICTSTLALAAHPGVRRTASLVHRVVVVFGSSSILILVYLLLSVMLFKFYISTYYVVM